MRPIKRLTVKVNQEEIENAMRANSKKCMIQQSIERDYPILENISVDRNLVRATDPERNVIYTFDIAALAKAAILKWDSGESIGPFSFTLRHPVVRERVKRKDGYMRPKHKEDAAKRSRGAVPRPKTKEGRVMSGRDRVFGAKLWQDELEKLRKLVLGIPQAAC
jgi:hypothetical protein